MMHQVIEHLDAADQEKALKEIIRVLKPERGIAFISTPNANSRPKWSRPYSPNHKKELSLDKFAIILNSHFTSTQIYGQRFLNKGIVGAAYQIVRASPLNNIYFNHLPRTLRLKVRDQLSINQCADVIKPITDRDIPRSLLAICRGLNK